MTEKLIDVDGALGRFGGNATIFKMLLKKFAASTYYNDLVEAIAAGDLVSAEHAAHTIKGTAGNLSLTPLFEIATLLDQQLKVQTDYIEPFEQLRVIYSETITEIGTYTA